MTNVAQSIREVIDPIAEDLIKVDQNVITDLQSDIPLIKNISDYIVSAGGKRMRPVVLMLIARALGYQGDQHVFLATMLEYVHTASLLHDDVVDESDLRRGKPTASFKWGNSAAVLVGDFMYSRAFQLMVQTGSLRICEIVAQAVNRVSEGEVIQLMNIHDTSVDETRYFDVIERKTATLFEAGARMAATLVGASANIEEAVAQYAISLGRAFQIVDDVLDYTGTAEDIGKNLGADLREGKMTMPLIHALRYSDEKEANVIRQAIKQGGGDLARITEIVVNSGAIESTMQLARQEVQTGISAITNLPDSTFRKSLIQLLSLTIERDR